MADPVLYVIAGPNGAGKSTFFDEVLGPVTHLRFINADHIAADQWGSAADEHAYEAAEQAALTRTQLIDARQSFATETVFSHASKVDLVKAAKDAGYRVTLHIVLIPEDLAVARVENRVEHGGHAVPEGKIRSRYPGVWAQLAEAIAVADDAIVYDNSRAQRPFRRVAKFIAGRLVQPADWPLWTPDALRKASNA